MKASYSKIKKLLPDLKLSAHELADLLTMHAFETVIDREYLIDPSITVVKIIKLDPHPNADRLRLATVSDGKKEIRVVCGAPNIEVGQVVPYAPPGAKVYDENGELFTLTEATIRGEKSLGMLNSVRELGISDDHGGILILPEETPLGSKLIDHIPSDVILDADILSDRVHDIISEEGIAREIAALLKLKGLSKRELGKHTITFDPDTPSKVAGVEIPHEEVKDILQRLGFSVIPAPEPESKSTWIPGQARDDKYWQVTVPPKRLDVLGEHDLVDEVVRMYGLDAIKPSNIVKNLHPLSVSESVYWTGLLGRTLAEAGFTETYSYSFEDERFAKLVHSEIHPHVELKNPMAPELKKLRYSMLPGLIGAMVKSRDEIHRAKNGALFEIGRVYHRGAGGTVPGVIERPVVAGIAVGNETTLQTIIDHIRELFQIEAISVIPASEPGSTSTWIPGQARNDKLIKPFSVKNLLKYADEFFGITYVFSDELLKKMKYRIPVVAFEVSINALLKHAPEIEIPIKTLDAIRNEKQDPVQFTELPKYPSVFRDISLLVNPEVTVEQIQEVIERIGKKLVVDVNLFDEYEATQKSSSGKRLGLTVKTPSVEEMSVDAMPKKSLAFHIEYRSSEKTLTDTEISEVHAKIEQALKKEFSAEIR